MKMPPPGAAMEAVAERPSKMRPPGMPEAEREAGTGKASPEDAGVIKEGEQCIDCANYSPDTGDCSKVEGYLSPGDGCVEYFDPLNDEEESPEESAHESPAEEAAEVQ